VRPRVILHNAISADGRTDGFTADLGLYYDLASRFNADAMLSGSETMLAAYASVEPLPEDAAAFEPPPSDPNDSRPLLIVVDSRGRIHNWHQIRNEPYWRGPVVLCAQATPKAYRDELQKRHIDSILSGDEHVDLRAALEELNARYGVKVVRVDSGGKLNGVLLRAGLVDEVSLLIHPHLVGGTTPHSIFTASDLASPEGVLTLRLAHVEQMAGDTLWIRYQILKG
jgi:2,5-diamino-6-(ribosylamino)-4(3H)-pyrimidinone 5'-phosphate reductase